MIPPRENGQLPPTCAQWDTPDAGRLRRYAEGTAAVALWMSIGLAFRLSDNAYLATGIPIALGFQRFVRRAPLRAMWVRSAPPFDLGIKWTVIGLLFSIFPLINLVGVIRSHDPFSPADAVWLAAAVVGAWPAAYAMRSFTRETLRQLWICLATAGLVGCAIMTALAFLNGIGNRSLGSRALTALAPLALYIPVQFFIEEVWFRGILDSHLHRPGETRGALSAIYGSALWGVWHYPTSDPKNLVNLLLYIAICVAVGTLLARAWRRSGNLLVPGIAHALIDAFGRAIAG